MVKRNNLVLIVVIVVVAVMIFSAARLHRTKATGAALQGEAVGSMAPDFTLQTVDGKPVKLSDYRGKAVLLNFWATWCPPCKVEMPWFEDLQKQYGKDGLVVLGIAMDDSEPATIAKFASELGVNYEVLLGTDQVSDDYGDVQYLPTTFYIGRDGTIVDKMTGLLERQDIEAAVKKALGSSPTPANVQQNQARVAANSAAMKSLPRDEPIYDQPISSGPTDR